MSEILIYLAIKYEGDWGKIYETLHDKLYIFNDEEIRKTLSEMKSKAVTILDSDYPEQLKESFKPPFVLFYYGDITLLKDRQKLISVVGSRKPSDYSLTHTEKIVGELSKDYVIVSGMAVGIDSAAHMAAISNGGKTVAILGSGIDYCYPSTNKFLYSVLKRDHLVVSEYPGKTVPDRKNFPFRNRLIAFASRALFVPHARSNSGSQVTVGYSILTNDTIFCLPYLIGEDSLCNRLINCGAVLVESADDIKKELE